MKNKSKINAWKKEISHHKHLILFSILLLIVALVLETFSLRYLRKIEGVVAPDLILDNIPTVNLSFIFTYGIAIVILLFFLYPLFYKVNYLHKAISQFSLLVLVRDAFITFTHLSIPLEAAQFHVPFWISFFTFENDLFFSGHTAIPFLGFLLFKDSKIRYFFLFTSILMAITVLLMHVHYSIDVFSAFFITYGTFKAGEIIFKKINHYD